MIASGALVMVEAERRDGTPVLRASTAGGSVELTATEAARLGAELIEWAANQDEVTA